MTEQINDDKTEETEESKGNWRRDLEQRLADEKARADLAEKNLTFTSVKGLDMSNKAHKFFADNYKGELTPDAITAAASDLGFISTEQTNTKANAEVSALTQMDNASQGATPADVQGSDEANLHAILNGSYDSLEAYTKAVQDAGYAKNLFNG